MDSSFKISLDMTSLVNSASKALDRLANVVFGGIERKNAWKEAMAACQLEEDRNKIARGECFFDGKKLIPTLPLPHMTSQNTLLAIEQDQQLRNLNSNLKRAIEILETETLSLEEVQENQKGKKEIDPDWFARWRREAKVISKPDIQRIWGRILAEEAKVPGRLSYRTLDVLKNLSSDDAATFNRVAKFALDGQMLVFKADENGTPRFTFGDCQQLNDAGLILGISTTILWQGHSDPSSGERFAKGKGFVIYADPKESSSEAYGPFPGLRLSSAGRELLSIADIPPPSWEELKEIFDIVVEFNKINNFSKKISLFRPDRSHKCLFEETI